MRRALALLAALGGALLAGVVPGSTGPATAAPGSEVRPTSYQPGVDPWTGDFADPAVLKVGDTYYGYATTLGLRAVPMFTSTDLSTWRSVVDHSPSGESTVTDGLPARGAGSWAYVSTDFDYVDAWAPSVARLPRGTFALAYSAYAGGSGQRCLGVATSTGPVTPYHDASTVPLVCPRGQTAIDPYLYVAGGRVWLLWKTQGKGGARIWGRELDPSLGVGGVAQWKRRSRARLLLRPTQRWEGGVVENPAMFGYAGHLYLFYSGNDFAGDRYATGYARCAGPLGPCRKVQRTPLLASRPGSTGPGGPAPVLGPSGELALGYAAHTTGYGEDRALHFARLGVRRGGTLSVLDPVWR